MQDINSMTTEQALRYLTRTLYKMDTNCDYGIIIADSFALLAAYRDICNKADDIIQELTLIHATKHL